jgi:hypothetical protein
VAILYFLLPSYVPQTHKDAEWNVGPRVLCVYKIYLYEAAPRERASEARTLKGKTIIFYFLLFSVRERERDVG